MKIGSNSVNARFTVTGNDKIAAKHLGIGEMSSFGSHIKIKIKLTALYVFLKRTY